jgi:hypothetical protein
MGTHPIQRKLATGMETSGRKEKVMLLKILDLLSYLQEKIGDGAEVSMTTLMQDTLVIQVDWVKPDYHFRYTLTKHRLDLSHEDNGFEEALLVFMVAKAKAEYQILKEKGGSPI